MNSHNIRKPGSFYIPNHRRTSVSKSPLEQDGKDVSTCSNLALAGWTDSPRHDGVSTKKPSDKVNVFSGKEQGDEAKVVNITESLSTVKIVKELSEPSEGSQRIINTSSDENERISEFFQCASSGNKTELSALHLRGLNDLAVPLVKKEKTSFAGGSDDAASLEDSTETIPLERRRASATSEMISDLSRGSSLDSLVDFPSSPLIKLPADDGPCKTGTKNLSFHDDFRLELCLSDISDDEFSDGDFSKEQRHCGLESPPSFKKSARKLSATKRKDSLVNNLSSRSVEKASPVCQILPIKESTIEMVPRIGKGFTDLHVDGEKPALNPNNLLQLQLILHAERSDSMVKDERNILSVAGNTEKEDEFTGAGTALSPVLNQEGPTSLDARQSRAIREPSRLDSTDVLISPHEKLLFRGAKYVSSSIDNIDTVQGNVPIKLSISEVNSGSKTEEKFLSMYSNGKLNYREIKSPSCKGEAMQEVMFGEVSSTVEIIPENVKEANGSEEVGFVSCDLENNQHVKSNDGDKVSENVESPVDLMSGIIQTLVDFSSEIGQDADMEVKSDSESSFSDSFSEKLTASARELTSVSALEIDSSRKVLVNVEQNDAGKKLSLHQDTCVAEENKNEPQSSELSVESFSTRAGNEELHRDRLLALLGGPDVVLASDVATEDRNSGSGSESAASKNLELASVDTLVKVMHGKETEKHSIGGDATCRKTQDCFNGKQIVIGSQSALELADQPNEGKCREQNSSRINKNVNNSQEKCVTEHAGRCNNNAKKDDDSHDVNATENEANLEKNVTNGEHSQIKTATKGADSRDKNETNHVDGRDKNATKNDASREGDQNTSRDATSRDKNTTKYADRWDKNATNDANNSRDKSDTKDTGSRDKIATYVNGRDKNFAKDARSQLENAAKDADSQVKNATIGSDKRDDDATVSSDSRDKNATKESGSRDKNATRDSNSREKNATKDSDNREKNATRDADDRHRARSDDCGRKSRDRNDSQNKRSDERRRSESKGKEIIPGKNKVDETRRSKSRSKEDCRTENERETRRSASKGAEGRFDDGTRQKDLNEYQSKCHRRDNEEALRSKSLDKDYCGHGNQTKGERRHKSSEREDRLSGKHRNVREKMNPHGEDHRRQSKGSEDSKSDHKSQDDHHSSRECVDKRQSKNFYQNIHRNKKRKREDRRRFCDVWKKYFSKKTQSKIDRKKYHSDESHSKTDGSVKKTNRMEKPESLKNGSGFSSQENEGNNEENVSNTTHAINTEKKKNEQKIEENFLRQEKVISLHKDNSCAETSLFSSKENDKQGDREQGNANNRVKNTGQTNCEKLCVNTHQNGPSLITTNPFGKLGSYASDNNVKPTTKVPGAGKVIAATCSTVSNEDQKSHDSHISATSCLEITPEERTDFSKLIRNGVSISKAVPAPKVGSIQENRNIKKRKYDESMRASSSDSLPTTVGQKYLRVSSGIETNNDMVKTTCDISEAVTSEANRSVESKVQNRVTKAELVGSVGSNYQNGNGGEPKKHSLGGQNSMASTSDASNDSDIFLPCINSAENIPGQESSVSDCEFNDSLASHSGKVSVMVEKLDLRVMGGMTTIDLGSIDVSPQKVGLSAEKMPSAIDGTRKKDHGYDPCRILFTPLKSRNDFSVDRSTSKCETASLFSVGSPGKNNSTITGASDETSEQYRKRRLSESVSGSGQGSSVKKRRLDDTPNMTVSEYVNKHWRGLLASRTKNVRQNLTRRNRLLPVDVNLTLLPSYPYGSARKGSFKIQKLWKNTYGFLTHAGTSSYRMKEINYAAKKFLPMQLKRLSRPPKSSASSRALGKRNKARKNAKNSCPSGNVGYDIWKKAVQEEYNLRRVLRTPTRSKEVEDTSESVSSANSKPLRSIVAKKEKLRSLITDSIERVLSRVRTDIDTENAETSVPNKKVTLDKTSKSSSTEDTNDQSSEVNSDNQVSQTIIPKISEDEPEDESDLTLVDDLLSQEEWDCISMTLREEDDYTDDTQCDEEATEPNQGNYSNLSARDEGSSSDAWLSIPSSTTIKRAGGENVSNRDLAQSNDSRYSLGNRNTVDVTTHGQSGDAQNYLSADSTRALQKRNVLSMSPARSTSSVRPESGKTEERKSSISFTSPVRNAPLHINIADKTDLENIATRPLSTNSSTSQILDRRDYQVRVDDGVIGSTVEPRLSSSHARDESQSNKSYPTKAVHVNELHRRHEPAADVTSLQLRENPHKFLADTRPKGTFSSTSSSPESRCSTTSSKSVPTVATTSHSAHLAEASTAAFTRRSEVERLVQPQPSPRTASAAPVAIAATDAVSKAILEKIYGNCVGTKIRFHCGLVVPAFIFRNHKGVFIFHCNSCRYYTSSKEKYKSHHAQHILDQCLQCQKCSFKASCELEMTVHARMHASDKSKCYCEDCDFVAENKGSIERHVMVHVYARDGTLDGFIELYSTGGRSGTDMRCPFCEEYFPDMLQVRSHVRVHTNAPVITCDECGFVSYSRLGHAKHVLVHCKQETLKCPHCPYITENTNEMKLHFFTHL
ncbi:uncharacterized protein LOC125179541 [Hyalella azteca]|uniref:Uncharacterized protein LOC125179541 n=1 Tax=Hyalella azteca TaxID=294128 RepID=A0A979FXV0_HYAAZ|nr:uncharacterized protein LOC125179541 [Hyalella azteca]